MTNLGRSTMIRKHHLVGLALLASDVVLPLPSCAPPGSGLQSYAPVAAPAPGVARVWFVRTKDPQEQFGDPIISANGQQVGRSVPWCRLLSRFSAGHLCLHGAELRYAHQCEGHGPAGTGVTDLSRGLVGRQLAGRHCRRRHLLCADAGAAAGPGLCQDVDRPGSAPGSCSQEI